jgi:hypothetical protein
MSKYRVSKIRTVQPAHLIELVRTHKKRPSPRRPPLGPASQAIISLEAERRLAEIVKAPVEQARAEARRIINEIPQGKYLRIIEGWHQLPDGDIQFTIRALLRCTAR